MYYLLMLKYILTHPAILWENLFIEVASKEAYNKKVKESQQLDVEYLKEIM